MQLWQRLGFVFVFSVAMIAQALAGFPEQSTIKTIRSMQEVPALVDSNTLVLFDLDHTVFEGKDYGYGHANWFYDQVEQGKAKGLDEKVVMGNMFPHWLHSQQDSKVKPVEPITPEIIKQLQAQGVTVLGLTSRQLPLVDITLKQLNSIGVNFNQPSLPQNSIAMAFTAPAMYKQGTIFCSDYNDKGEVLKAYLNKLNIKPTQILFIDDSKRNLESVSKAFDGHATVVGLYYPLVAEYKKQHWNAKTAQQAYYDVYMKTPSLQAYPLDKP